MTILAIDLGTRTGYAILRDGEPRQVGLFRLSGEDEQDHVRFVGLDTGLRELVRRAHPSLIAYERVRHAGGGVGAVQVYGGLRAILLVVAAHAGVPYVGVEPARVKRAAGLRSAAGKPEMLAAARARWPGLAFETDDVADACFVGVAALAQAFVVRVVDSVGTPMSGVDVIWDGPAGSSVSPTTSKSDTSGLTQTSVTALATLAGTYDGYARLAVDQNATRLAHFPTTITPADPAKIVKLSGDQQSYPAGQTLPTEIEVQLQDQYGNGVPGVQTQWSPSSGGSVVVGNSTGITSGPSGPGQGGIVAARWTLGNTTGSQTLTVAAGSLAITFTATATQATGPLATLTPIQGDGVSASVGSNVNLGVKAADASGTAIPGVSISWSTSTNGATITGTSTTDQTGVARATATLAAVAGPNRFSASAPASPAVTPAAFTVTATPGRACRLQFSNMGQTGDRGDPLPVNVQMAVYDSLNNPVPGFSVNIFFRSSSPDVSGTVSALTTDNTGLASTGGAVTLGSAIGSQEIDQNTVRPCFWNNAPFNAIGVGTMNALATPVSQLANITAVQSGAAGSTVLLKVRATDRHGFYVPSSTLNAAITSGNGTFGGGGTTASTSTTGAGAGTDAGTALLSYVIGSASSQQITITSTDGPSVIITIQRNP